MSVKKWVILNGVKDPEPLAKRVLSGNYFRQSL
jgi:hypothetical protein